MNKIYIIILNYNGGEDTLECMESVSRIDKGNNTVKILLVDNGSNDGSVAKIRDKYSDAIIIENKENLGFTGGNNEGIRYALKSGADYIMLLNNDTTVDRGLLVNMMKGFDSKLVGGVVPKIYFSKGSEYHKGRYEKKDLGNVIWYSGGIMDWENLIGKNRGVDEVDLGQYDTEDFTELATGCCFLLSAKAINKVGAFDDKYFLYYEDADLSQRLKKSKFKIKYMPNAFLWHKNAKSSGGTGSDLQDYYITRNRMSFGMKYAPLRTKIALIKESISLLRSGRNWQKRAVKDFFAGKLGRGSYR